MRPAIARIKCFLVTTMLFLLVLPGVASANPLEFPLPLPPSAPPQLLALMRSQVSPATARTPFHPGLWLETDDGYRVGVIGSGDGVLLYVTRGGGRALTGYVARGTVTPRRLQASFGKYGEVAMRFRPSAGSARQGPNRHCAGAGRFASRTGVFVGSLRFRGEGGYVSVNAHRAKGLVSGVAPQCERGQSDRREERAIRPSQRRPWGLDPSFLSASWRRAITSASLGVIGFGEKSLFVATAEQSEGSVAKIRFAFGLGGKKAFTVDDALTTARVSPPAPFKGTGTYRAAADGTTTWSGTLSVGFPGAGRFALAGPPFTAAVGKSVFGDGLPPFAHRNRGF